MSGRSSRPRLELRVGGEPAWACGMLLVSRAGGAGCTELWLRCPGRMRVRDRRGGAGRCRRQDSAIEASPRGSAPPLRCGARPPDVDGIVVAGPYPAFFGSGHTEESGTEGPRSLDAPDGR